VRENIASKFVTIQHVEGKLNLADILRKRWKIPIISLHYAIWLCVIDTWS